MEWECLLFILLINLGCVVSELSLRFVFIVEEQETDLPEMVGKALKLVEESRRELLLSGDVVQLDREAEDEGYRKLCATLAKGASIIIDLSWSPWEMAEELSTSKGLPWLRTLLGPQQLVSAMDSHLESRNATDAAILLETESDVDMALYQLLGKSNVRVWVHAGLNLDSARSLKLMRPEPSFFVVVGGATFVRDTYRRAVKEKLVRRAYRWVLVVTDYSASILDSEQPVLPAAVLRVDTSECCKLLGREECEYPVGFQRKQHILNALVHLLVATFTKLPDLPPPRPVRCDEPSGPQYSRGFRDLLSSETSSNDTLFFWDPNSSSLLLRSQFVLSIRKADAEETVAKWSADGAYQLLPGVVLEPLRMFYRVGTAPAIPWTMPKLDPAGKPLVDEDGQPLFHGYCIDLIEKLSQTMGFDYEIVSPRSGGFGHRLPNGSWNGVVGDLMRGETDIAVAALTMTAEREEVIDFVAPYFEQTGILIAIRKPIRKTSLFKFMTVLRTEVWLSIVAALLLTGVMIWLLEKYSPYSARNNPDAYPYPCREFTLKESFWFALTSFTPQGGGEAPKALSGRTLVAAYWLFVVLMLATFTANLAAFLTVERMQLHSSRVWKEITLNATSDQAQYRVWDYPIREQYGHILLAINASGPVADAESGFREVNEHTEADFAFIHDSAEIKYEVTRNCNLTEVGEVFAEQPYAIAVQQGSRLQESLSRALLELQKERFLEQLSAKWALTFRYCIVIYH
ncbi:unnamed protein product, partial [Iphiclides podalirius]